MRIFFPPPAGFARGRSVLLGAVLLGSAGVGLMIPCALPRAAAAAAAVPAGETTMGEATGGEATVNIDNFSFAPAAITVPAGTKITWNNRDDIPHTVTDAADARTFKSPALDTGDSFSRVFSTPGTYRYFCSLHPHMQGTVVVK